MDAIGKWKNGVLIAVKNYGKACAHNAQSPATFELEQAQEDAYVAVCKLLAEGAKVSNLGDVRWLATEDGSEGKGTGRHIACFVLDQTTNEEL